MISENTEGGYGNKLSNGYNGLDEVGAYSDNSNSQVAKRDYGGQDSNYNAPGNRYYKSVGQDGYNGYGNIGSATPYNSNEISQRFDGSSNDLGNGNNYGGGNNGNYINGAEGHDPNPLFGFGSTYAASTPDAKASAHSNLHSK